MDDFKQLEVWQRSQAVALRIYRVAGSWPPIHDVLSSDVRSAAITIPAKIANGCGRGGSKGFARMLSVALRSARELEYHLRLAKDLGALGPLEHEEITEETRAIRRMLASHIRRATPRAVSFGRVLRRRPAAVPPRTDN